MTEWSVADDEGVEHQSPRLWLVTVTDERSAQFWIEADDRESAEGVAGTLASDLEDWDQWERNQDVMRASHIRQRPQHDDLLWTGGERGDWRLLVVPDAPSPSEGEK